MDNIYPIGSIFISTNTTNPSTYFGGKWERIKGRFLLGANDSTYKIGATGGEAKHQLTVKEMPSHTHDLYLAINGGSDVANVDRVALDGYGYSRWWGNLYKMDNSGGNQAHNNMPPYLVVYIWKRIS